MEHMEEKDGKELGRVELAEYLESLAGQLRRGAMDVDGRTWTVPEKLDVKIGFKEKKGRLIAKLKCGWSTLDQYDQPVKQEVTAWKSSVKDVKKKMTSDFYNLRKVVESGEFPDESSVSAFVESAKAFAAMADPDWQEAMAEFMDHLQNFLRAVESRNMDLTLHELRDLTGRKGACHREFK